VTFKVVPGEKVGVCGRTGAGKSSLIQCVFRMVTLAGGAIEVDGVDTRDIPLPVLRGKLGMVPQDSWLFSGTLRSNLDAFNQYTDAEIWATLELVNLAPSIKSYEEGLSKEVEEKGTNFSVGTVQMICLARVLLKKPKIIFWTRPQLPWTLRPTVSSRIQSEKLSPNAPLLQLRTAS